MLHEYVAKVIVKATKDGQELSIERKYTGLINFKLINGYPVPVAGIPESKAEALKRHLEDKHPGLKVQSVITEPVGTLEF